MLDRCVFGAELMMHRPGRHRLHRSIPISDMENAAVGQKEGDHCDMSRASYTITDDMLAFTELSGWPAGVQPSIL